MRSRARRRSGRWDVGDAGRTLGSLAATGAACMQGLSGPGVSLTDTDTRPLRSLFPPVASSPDRLDNSPSPALLLQMERIGTCESGPWGWSPPELRSCDVELLRTPRTGVLDSECSAPVPSRVPQVISVFLYPTWWPGSHWALGESSQNVERGNQHYSPCASAGLKPRVISTYFIASQPLYRPSLDVRAISLLPQPWKAMSLPV